MKGDRTTDLVLSTFLTYHPSWDYIYYFPMTEVTSFEARYVDKHKLETLLQQLFSDSYIIRVCIGNSACTITLYADACQSQGDSMEVTAPRLLTEVRHSVPQC